MKADQIIKNAKIFTANKDNLLATALVVKDGKFIYVGDEAGLSAYEGEATDLQQVSDSLIWIRASTFFVPAKRKLWILWRKASRTIQV